MITDKEQIRRAVEYVFEQGMYIPLPRDMFDDICPNPEYLIHVNGRSAAEAIRLLQIEAAIAARMDFAGMVLYLNSRSVTMAELDTINTIVKSLRPARRFQACSSLAKPEEGEIEIWIFGQT